MTKIPKGSRFYGDWSLVVEYCLEFGEWNLTQGAAEDAFFEELKRYKE